MPRLTRDQVRALAPCPECEAKRGQFCVSFRRGYDKPRETNHQARVNRAQASLAGEGRETDR